MLPWESLAITISLIVIAVVFVVLLGTIAALCMKVRGAIKKCCHMGCAIEERISPSKKCPECRCKHHGVEEESIEEPAPLAADILEWTLLGVSLWQKIKSKRK